MAEVFSAQWHTERKGLYFETVQKLVDGIVEDVKAGKIGDRGKLQNQVEANVRQDAYVNDDILAAEVLRYSNRACEGLAKVAQHPTLLRLAMIEKRFPWRGLAEEAFYHDCWDELCKRTEIEILYQRCS